jgi:hypothetical protein
MSGKAIRDDVTMVSGAEELTAPKSNVMQWFLHSSSQVPQSFIRQNIVIDLEEPEWRSLYSD